MSFQNLITIESEIPVKGKIHGVREGTILRAALPKDIIFVDSLRKKEASALGFIPKVHYDNIVENRPINGLAAHRHSELIVTEDNKQLTGFSLISYTADLAKIVQICVQRDARRWHRALLMIDHIEAEAKKRVKRGVTARVAYDLESNIFWKAVGYTVVDKVVSTWLGRRSSSSKRPLFIYEKLFETANKEFKKADWKIVLSDDEE